YFVKKGDRSIAAAFTEAFHQSRTRDCGGDSAIRVWTEPEGSASNATISNVSIARNGGPPFATFGSLAAVRFDPARRGGHARRGSDAVARGRDARNPHRVRTAALVAPRTKPAESRKRTKIRLRAGSNGTTPLPVTNTAKLDVAPAAMARVRSRADCARHRPCASV